MNHVWLVFERDVEGPYFKSVHRTRAGAREAVKTYRKEELAQRRLERDLWPKNFEGANHPGFFVHQEEVRD